MTTIEVILSFLIFVVGLPLYCLFLLWLFSAMADASFDARYGAGAADIMHGRNDRLKSDPKYVSHKRGKT